MCAGTLPAETGWDQIADETADAADADSLVYPRAQQDTERVVALIARAKRPGCDPQGEELEPDG
jgi:hypothetical protein